MYINSVFFRYKFYFYFLLFIYCYCSLFFRRIFTHYVVQHNRRVYAVRIVTIDALELHGSPRIYNKSNGVRTRHINDTCHVCMWKHGNYYDILYKILQYMHIMDGKMLFRYRHTSTALVKCIYINIII